MTQFGEGIAIAAPLQKEPKKQEKEKEPIKIRIALFFDGTLNNRTNIEAREKNTQHYLDNQKAGNSFENGRTNIAIMETNMSTEVPVGYDAYKSLYIPGQGTFDLKGDNLWGYSMAIFDSGVPGRAKLGVQQAVSAVTGIDDFDPEKQFIEKITIDVFGFSRGAATARYAIYLLLKDKKALYVRLQNLGYEVDENTVEVGFAGLYDTVLSYMASQKFKSANNKLEQTAHKYANKVVHLASAEEHRKDFPLHNIKCSKGKKGEEYFLPGVHSDVGGSYNKADEEKIKNEPDQTKKRKLMMVTNDENLTLNKGTLGEMEADKQWLVKQGWYRGTLDNRDLATIKSDATKKVRELEKQSQYKIEIKDGEFTITLFFMPNQSQSGYGLGFYYATLSVKRSNIYSGYSSIPLKIMAEFVNKETKLGIKPKLEKRANAVIEISNLTELESKIKAYVAKKPTDSKPEDWLDNPLLANYRHQHLNFSARCGIGYAPRFSEDKRTRFIYDA